MARGCCWRDGSSGVIYSGMKESAVKKHPAEIPTEDIRTSLDLNNEPPKGSCPDKYARTHMHRLELMTSSCQETTGVCVCVLWEGGGGGAALCYICVYPGN